MISLASKLTATGVVVLQVCTENGCENHSVWNSFTQGDKSQDNREWVAQ